MNDFVARDLRGTSGLQKPENSLPKRKAGALSDTPASGRTFTIHEADSEGG